MTIPKDERYDAAAARVAATVYNASAVVMAMWPLNSFIAANPARVLEAGRFDQAVAGARARLGGRGLLPPADYHALARRGLIALPALAEAFARHTRAATASAGTDPLLPVGGVAVPAATVQWLGHFESVVAGFPCPSADPLAEAALVAAARCPLDAGPPQTGRREEEPALRAVDVLMTRWCAAYVDTGQASWPMPHRERGFWKAWRRLAPLDPTLPAAVKGALKTVLAALPAGPEGAVATLLQRLQIAEEDGQAALEQQLLRLPGWASFLKWRAEQAGSGTVDSTLLTQYLAARLAYAAAFRESGVTIEADSAASIETVVTGNDVAVIAARRAALKRALTALAAKLGLSPASVRGLPVNELSALAGALAAMPDDLQSLIWLEAHEDTYRRSLLEGLAERLPLADAEPEPAARPAAQLVFCIDVRSEPFRRHLEAAGPFETLGFAGFYGVPVQYTAYGEAATPLDVCPALLRPRYRVTDRPTPACAGLGARHRGGRDFMRQMKKVVSGLKGHVAACFGFVESVGGLFAAPFLGRTFAPQGFAAAGAWVARRLAPPIEVTPDVRAPSGPGDGHGHGHGHEHGEAGPAGLPYGLAFEERVFFAEAALSIMGLTGPIGRLVVFNGHGSATENNPYKAALDCGACGGNPGGQSGRILAAILNEPEVRAGLAERGLAIPADTIFLAGEHNTTTDEVTLFSLAELPESHRGELASLKQGLAIARARTTAERRARLTLAGDPETPAVVHTRRRALDWAQVRPEWGLARNGAFIIGPRSLTKGVNLEGRTFLHSYDWASDESGKALEIILTAPMVVAEWINTQYYFSTVDNDRFGSGSKVTHNVVGQIGVMQGNASDLQIGLPQQSVMVEHGRPYHEPLRLTTVCLAPPSRVAEIVANNTILQQLFDNEWVALVVIEPIEGRLLRYRPGRIWQDVTPPGPGCEGLPDREQVPGLAQTKSAALEVPPAGAGAGADPHPSRIEEMAE